MKQVAPTDSRAPTPRISFGLVAAFYLASGALGLIYEVAFAKYLGFSFGATAAASSAVLIAFMGGLALGAYAAGRIEHRVVRPLYLYGIVEVMIGAFCFVAPGLLSALGDLYVVLAGKTQSIAILTAVRGGLATAIVAVPAIGMGTTLPFLARFIHGMVVQEGADVNDPASRRRAGQRLAALYGINTLGGALGSLGSAYVIIPALGLPWTLRVCACVSVTIGVVSLWLGRNYIVEAPHAEDSSEAESPAVADASAAPLVTRKQALILAGMSGLLVFSAEVVATHLLALVIGTSVYAFGLMLAIFLVCLSIGTPLARWMLHRFDQLALPMSLGATGIAMIASLPIWDQLPDLFLSLGPHVRTWHGRELVRGLAAFTALCIPVTLMGTTFPLVLRSAEGKHVVRDTGRLTSFNTVGSILGSLLAGFLLIELLGSYRCLLVISAGYLAGSMVAAYGNPLRVRRAGTLAVVGVAAMVLVPPWNLRRLTSGTNVYFDPGAVEDAELESIHEDIHGGVTTIVRDPKTGERTLLTNGKFQGNDSREVAQNKGLAYLPTFFAARPDSALIIGMGTGVTAGALAEFPYQRIDVAELAPAMIDAARTTFAGVNNDVLSDPRVHVMTEDGRNVLLVNAQKYDVITVEVSSIWFAGAANLYNREFYDIAKKRMTKGGVLQQWFQFHHTDRRIVTTVLATIRDAFPHLLVLADGHQGHILASLEPLRARLERIEDFADTSGIERSKLLEYVRGAILDGKAIDEFVSDTARATERRTASFISTDENLVLEYATPRGNVPTADDIPTTLRYLYEYQPPGIVRTHVKL